VALGLVATLIVVGGPGAVGFADRFAVALLAVSGVVFSIACARAPWPATMASSSTVAAVVRAFDVVFGYQTSWLLMFGDYSRYSRSGRAAGGAVFAGLGITALWFIPLGLFASTVARSGDPGVMVRELGLGWWGGVLVVLATLTTNFVNIYMSALALKSLRATIQDRAAIWLIGGVGAAISVFSSTWLNQLANFTLVLAGVFVPVGGILVAHFVIARTATAVETLYPGPDGDTPLVGRWSVAGMIAWMVGALVFYVAQPMGGVAPSLLVSIVTYLGLKAGRARQTDEAQSSASKIMFRRR
jgi:purine-cytosine permease-like protein